MKEKVIILAVCIITAIVSDCLVGNYKEQQEMRMRYEDMQSIISNEEENEMKITPDDTQRSQTTPPEEPKLQPDSMLSTSTDDKGLEEAQMRLEEATAEMDRLGEKLDNGEISHEEYFAKQREFFDGPFREYFTKQEEFFSEANK